jgi:PEP-CTERM motif
MFKVRMAAAAAIAGAMSFWAIPASAVTIDPTDTYTVSGSYTVGFDPSITGTLTVDLKTDTVTAANINTGSSQSGGFGTFTTISNQGTDPFNNKDYFVDLTNSSGESFFLVLDTTSTLFGGKTTTIDPSSDFFNRFGGPCGSCDNFTGSLVVQAVPEPSTWAMIVLGFLGVGFVACRRTTPGLQLA